MADSHAIIGTTETNFGVNITSEFEVYNQKLSSTLYIPVFIDLIISGLDGTGGDFDIRVEMGSTGTIDMGPMTKTLGTLTAGRIMLAEFIYIANTPPLDLYHRGSESPCLFQSYR